MDYKLILLNEFFPTLLCLQEQWIKIYSLLKPSMLKDKIQYKVQGWKKKKKKNIIKGPTLPWTSWWSLELAIFCLNKTWKFAEGDTNPNMAYFYDNLPKLPAFCLTVQTTLVGLSNKAGNKGHISAQLQFLKLWVYSLCCVCRSSQKCSTRNSTGFILGA